MNCLFCAIVAGEIPASKVKENDNVLAFNDINPQAPTHILIIPKVHFENAEELAAADEKFWQNSLPWHVTLLQKNP